MDEALISRVRELAATDPTIGYRGLHALLKEDPNFKNVGLKKVQSALQYTRQEQQVSQCETGSTVAAEASAVLPPSKTHSQTPAHTPPKPHGEVRQSHIAKLYHALEAIKLPCSIEKEAILQQLLAVNGDFEEQLTFILRRLGAAYAMGSPELRIECAPFADGDWDDDKFLLEYARRVIEDKLPVEGRLPRFFRPTELYEAFIQELGRRSMSDNPTRSEAQRLMQEALARLPKTSPSVPIGDLADMTIERLKEFVMSSYEEGEEKTEVEAQLQFLENGLSAADFKGELVKFARVVRKDCLSRMNLLNQMDKPKVVDDSELDNVRLQTLVPDNLNPSNLAVWQGDLKPKFQEQFSFREGLESKISEGSAPADPHLQLRTVLLSLSAFLDKGNKSGFCVNASDQSVGIILRVVGCRSAENDPVLEVDWLFSTQESFCRDAEQTAFGKLLAEGKPCSIEVSRTAVLLLRYLLKINFEKLTAAYIEARSSSVIRPIKVSVLSPIPKTKPPRDTKPCKHCGVMTATPKFCAKCGEVYCGSECQKVHWPQHKNDCKQRQKAPPDCAEVNLAVLTPMATMFAQLAARPGFGSSNMNMNSSRIGKGKEHDNFREQITQQNEVPTALLGTNLVVKVQVAMGAPLTGDSRIYDKNRMLDFFAGPSNCTRFEELARTIVSKGASDGLKGYFRAWLPAAKDGAVKIDFKKGPLPPERW